MEFLQTISIKYSYLTNKRSYPKRCSLKSKEERTKLTVRRRRTMPSPGSWEKVARSDE